MACHLTENIRGSHWSWEKTKVTFWFGRRVVTGLYCVICDRDVEDWDFDDFEFPCWWEPVEKFESYTYISPFGSEWR